ncbi:putative toxin-antitoxin system toxin component, PIN family [Steroidobacter sp.]|uniref:putative toxin-antitoxin system toxin component, PIN family n=1 Tax=Steroidobacter sp. TaxID=1978227 RepID=UPI001A646850|nr:putative toxin-antitoxin system toxin component, PIN family [Steroidobacter sp.]MBL8266181.1 putative toxin-antitoxin system toxin component, PIN family [Steroidobacter sp.]
MKLVLDTNVVLDWLVFRDPAVASLESALTTSRVEILTHAAALDELRRVLAYEQFKLPLNDQQQAFDRYSSQARIINLPAEHLDHSALPPSFPRCRDRDDEHFLALAYHTRADALVSKDNHLLELTKRVRKFGVTILTPAQLAASLASATASRNASEAR